VPDAYEVLGVEATAEASLARRQFMKLSLWVHPDKNAHAKASDAFHAADVAYKMIKARTELPGLCHSIHSNIRTELAFGSARLKRVGACHAALGSTCKAQALLYRKPGFAAVPEHAYELETLPATLLQETQNLTRRSCLVSNRICSKSRTLTPKQDKDRRAALDAAREDAGLRKAAIAQAEDLERARQWRLARGTATEEDRQGPISAQPQGRGSWMTQLPVSRRPTAPQQVRRAMRQRTTLGNQHQCMALLLLTQPLLSWWPTAPQHVNPHV